MLETVLRLLFKGDESAMLDYIGDQLSRLEKLPLADFVFSREFRGRYADTAAVPAKRIAE